MRETLKDYMKKTHNGGPGVRRAGGYLRRPAGDGFNHQSPVQRGGCGHLRGAQLYRSLNSFRSYGVRLRGVPMDDDGMNLEALETALREEPNAKFIYTIPTFKIPPVSP